MKIRLFDAIEHKPKLTLINTDKKMQYSNLTYSDSLEDIGSCSFDIVPQGDGDEVSELANEITGLEYIYLENSNGEIVWGGILASFQADEVGLSVQCIGMKYIFEFMNIETDLTVDVTGNYEDTLQFFLDLAKTKRSIPVVMSENSDVVGTGAFSFSAGKSIYSCMKDVVNAGSIRFIFEYEKDGIYVIPKMVVRSTQGVTPEGVGLNRGLESDETDDKLQLKYTTDSPRESNLNSVSVNYDLRGMVSKGTLVASIGGTPTTFTSNSLALQSFFGKVEKFEINYEVNDSDTAQAVVNKFVTYPPFRATVGLTPDFDFELNVGDRVGFLLKTKSISLFTPEESGGVTINKPVTVRIDEKRVSFIDGVPQIELLLAVGNSSKSDKDFISQVNKTRKDTTAVSTRFISS